MRAHNRRLQAGLEALAAASVIAVGAYLRLRGLQHGPIDNDQSNVLGIAFRLVNGGVLPLTANKSSIGVMNPPLIEYMLALPLFVKQDLLWVAGFIAVLNILSLVACYGVVAALAGKRAALIATLLYAASPWAVYYSRFIWNQNAIPFFSTLLLGSLLLYFAREHRPVYLVLSFLALAAVIQVHLVSLVLVVVVGLIFLLFHRRVNPRYALLGSALFLATFVPYFLYLRLTGFADVKALFGTFGGQAARFDLAPALIVGDLATGSGISGWPVPNGAAWQQVVSRFFTLSRLEGWLLAASALYAGWRVLVQGGRDLARKREASAHIVMYVILLLWLIVPTVLYLRRTVYLQNYYFLYIYPAPFVMIGVALDDAFRQLRAWVGRQSSAWLKPFWAAAKLSVVGAALVISAGQFQVLQAHLGLLDAGAAYDYQVQEMRQVVSTARQVMSAHPECGLIVISQGHKPEASPFGFLADAGVSPDVRYVADAAGLIVPQGCAVYLDTTDSGWAQAWLGSQLTELTEDRVDAPGGPWRFYYKPAGALPSAWAEEQPLGEWTGGVSLVDAQVKGPVAAGSTFDLLLVWKVTATSDGQYIYHFYNHLARQEDGVPVAQADGPGVYTPYWRAGDYFVTRFSVAVPQDVPAGEYQIRLGLYSLSDLQRMPLTDGSDGLVIRDIAIPSAQ